MTRDEASVIAAASGQVPGGITRFEKRRGKMSELHAFDVTAY